MPLVVTLAGKDSVAFGSDSRGITGSGISKRYIGDVNNNKIITDNAAILTCGKGYIAQTYVDEFKTQLNDLKANNLFDDQGLDEIGNLAHFFGRRFCRGKYEEAFGYLESYERPYLGFIITGLDKSATDTYYKPKMYKINCDNNFEPELGERSFLTDGTDDCDKLAQYLLDKICSQDFDIDNLDELFCIIGFVLNESVLCNVFPDVGNPIKIGYISSGGTKMEAMVEEDTKNYICKLPEKFINALLKNYENL